MTDSSRVSNPGQRPNGRTSAAPPPAGWYPDPTTRVGRYWDGQQWTDRLWSGGLLSGPGWLKQEGDDQPFYFDGRNWQALPPRVAWKQIVKKLRTPREVYEDPHVRVTMTRVARFIENRLSSPWLSPEKFGEETRPLVAKYSALLARDTTPIRYGSDGWFVDNLRSNISNSLGNMVAEIYVQRRDDLRSHDPKKRAGNVSFQPGGPAPEPAKYGVSHEGAEHLVAEWMIYLGEVDAQVTRLSGDGGIDVESSHYVAQVKNYGSTQSVTSSDLRELKGVSTITGRKPLFFTSGTYPRAGIEFAEVTDIALFHYDAVEGSLTASNQLAADLLKHGL